jgi:hypothetical protein
MGIGDSNVWASIIVEGLPPKSQRFTANTFNNRNTKRAYIMES